MPQQLVLTKKERSDFDKAQEAYCATKKKAIWLLVGGTLVASTCFLIFQETLLGPFLSVAGGIACGIVAVMTLAQNKGDWESAQRFAEAFSDINRKHDCTTTYLFNTDSVEAHRALIARIKPYLKERNSALKQAAPVYQPPSRRVAGWGVFAGLTLGATIGAAQSTVMLGLAAVTFSLWKAWEAYTTTKDKFDVKAKKHQDEVREFRSELKSYRSNITQYRHAIKRERLEQELKAFSL